MVSPYILSSHQIPHNTFIDSAEFISYNFELNWTDARKSFWKGVRFILPLYSRRSSSYHIHVELPNIICWQCCIPDVHFIYRHMCWPLSILQASKHEPPNLFGCGAAAFPLLVINRLTGAPIHEYWGVGFFMANCDVKPLMQRNNCNHLHVSWEFMSGRKAYAIGHNEKTIAGWIRPTPTVIYYNYKCVWHREVIDLEPEGDADAIWAVVRIVKTTTTRVNAKVKVSSACPGVERRPCHARNDGRPTLQRAVYWTD